ncbi:hypothetical protein, partial [Escherichia coli]|uniref:hypothetical protein n=1 Tax=Escherichia coli TaxID=562 RepID=UPI0039E08A0C
GISSEQVTGETGGETCGQPESRPLNDAPGLNQTEVSSRHSGGQRAQKDANESANWNHEKVGVSEFPRRQNVERAYEKHHQCEKKH